MQTIATQAATNRNLTGAGVNVFTGVAVVATPRDMVLRLVLGEGVGNKLAGSCTLTAAISYNITGDPAFDLPSFTASITRVANTVVVTSLPFTIPAGTFNVTCNLASSSGSDTAVRVSGTLYDASAEGDIDENRPPKAGYKTPAQPQWSHTTSGTYYGRTGASTTFLAGAGDVAGDYEIETATLAGLSTGHYTLVIQRRVGGSPATTDPVVGLLSGYWDNAASTWQYRGLQPSEHSAIGAAVAANATIAALALQVETGGGPYVDDPVVAGRLASLRRTTSGLVASGANGITIKVGDTTVLCGADFARDLPSNARVSSIVSLTPSAAGFTATAVGVDHTKAKFTLTATSAGTYTLAVKVVYSLGGGTVTGTVTVKVIA